MIEVFHYCTTSQRDGEPAGIQRAAAHYNTLRHTTTHCTTLQNTANTILAAILKHWLWTSFNHSNAGQQNTSETQHAATHCNTLQHTATYCNTLQHTATHCNTLQHTATIPTIVSRTQVKLSALPHTVTHYNTLQHTSTHCNYSNAHQHNASETSTTLQHTAIHYNILQHTATHCNTLQYTATIPTILSRTQVKLSVLQHTVTHYNTLQHTTTHCNYSNAHQHNASETSTTLHCRGKPFIRCKWRVL